MQFSGNSNSLDICTMADKLVKTSSSSFPVAEKALFANQGSRIILSWIFMAYGGWVYDDGNNDDLPSVTGNIISGQQIYVLPEGAEYVRGVSVKDESGLWRQLIPITLESILERQAENEFENVDSLPHYYRVVGDVVKIYPASNYEQDASIQIDLSREISEFLPTDTTKEPGFDSRFHEAVPTFMALQFAKINRLDIKTDLQRDWDGNEDATGREGGYKLRVKRHYSRKFADMFPPKLSVRDTWSESL